MTAANTQKSELRKISQKSSLVCSLLEGRKGKTRFDYDGILPLYNRNNLYSRATTSQDNQTHDLAFSGALSFVWNHELFELKPAKERVISLHFAESDLNETTSKAWRELNKLSPEQLAVLGHFILSNREHFENGIIKQYQDCTSHLQASGITTTRIADNHAIALAGVYSLLDIVGKGSSGYGLLEYATERANRKLETAKTDSHLADYFFSCIAEMDSGAGVLIDNDNNQLIVHLPSALKELGDNGQGFNDKAALIAELKHHERFVTIKKSKAFVGKIWDCYHFKI